MSIEKIH
jgi:hypothetical protein